LIFDGSPTTLPSGADGLEGPPLTKFYELRDNLLALVGYIWTRMQIDAQIRMIRASDPKVPIGDLSR
jgi:hypothetical protein